MLATCITSCFISKSWFWKSDYILHYWSVKKIIKAFKDIWNTKILLHWVIALIAPQLHQLQYFFAINFRNGSTLKSILGNAFIHLFMRPINVIVVHMDGGVLPGCAILYVFIMSYSDYTCQIADNNLPSSWKCACACIFTQYTVCGSASDAGREE